jgi:hypothetical protein
VAITKVGNGVTDRLSGNAGTTFDVSFTGLGVAAGDVVVLDMLNHAAGVAAPTGLPSGATNVVAWSSSTDAVTAGVWVYRVPSTPPSGVTVTFGTAREGNLLWSIWRGVDATTALDAAVGLSTGTNGWAASVGNSINAPSVTTVTAGAQIVAGVHIGSGSEVVTPPSGSTVLATGGRRRGVMVDRGLVASPGSSGIATYSYVNGYRGRAYQIALRPAVAGGTPGAIAGVSTSSLTDPAARWVKGTQRVSWHDGSNWGAVLPTATGHRLFTNLSSPNAGTVVDSRQGSRPTVVQAPGWLGILRGHPTQSRFSSYNTASSYAALVTDAVVPLTPGNTDQSPISLTRSPNGYLWAAMVAANKVTVTRSTDNGATWGAAQDVVTGWTAFPTGVVALSVTGATVVLLATGNDGAGRAALSIPQGSASYAAASWTTETLPALAAGADSDDHLSMTVAPDGRIFAAAKTTNAAANIQLLYLLVRSTGGVWSSSNIEVGPDDDGGTSPGYTRPTITLTYDKVVVAYGSIYSPQNLSYRTTSLASPGTWSARQTLLTGPNYWDSAQTPPAEVVRAARGNFPILSHQVSDGTVILSWMASDTPAAPTVTNPIVGQPFPDSLKVSMDTTGAQSVRLKYGSTYGPSATPDGDGWVQPTISGLPSFTGVTFDVELTEADGAVTVIPAVASGKTAPVEGVATSFRFSTVSCFEDTASITTISNAGSFARMKARNPDLVFLNGDAPYGDNESTSQASHRADIETMLAYSPALRTLLASTAVVPQQSDHDFAKNNAFPGVYTPANRAAYRQVWPLPTLPSSTGQYRAFTYGRVRFIVTDTRSFAVPNSTRLGATQKAWFKAELQRPEPVKIWVQESIWIDDNPTEAGGDKWQDVPAEKAELGAFIATEAVGVVGTVTGDQHAISADDGSNNPWGGFFSFCAAPARNTSSIKTTSAARWSHGMYPTTEGVEVAQDGICDVTDTGTTITLAFRGYDTSGTQRVSMDVVVDTTPPVSTGPKVITAAGVETAATWSVITAPGVETPITSWGVITAPGVETALV